ELLLVTNRAQRDDAERLGLTPGEQRRAVGAGQDAHLARDRPDLGRLAPVRTHAFPEDLAANPLLDLGLEALRQVGQAVRELRAKLGNGLLLQIVERGLAQRLVGIEGRLVEALRQEPVDRLVDFGVLGAFWDDDLRLADLAGKGILHLADPNDLPMRQAQGLDDGLLGHFLRPGLDHDDGFPGAGYDEVELALRQPVDRRTDDELVVEYPDADGADRALERDRRDRERQRGAVDGHGGGIRILVDREHRRHHLDVVAEVFGKERTDRPIDQAAIEDGLLARTSFTADESARDLARR